jgi:V-type H+-transporting ATPase subunit a
MIVETYGIHSYQEANPAVVSIITFPFLFGMMFGDIGHGSLILIVGLVLTLMGETLKKGRDTKELALVRYIFLLMGFFAVYCGFIYNEFFAIPLSLFPTCY